MAILDTIKIGGGTGGGGGGSWPTTTTPTVKAPSPYTKVSNYLPKAAEETPTKTDELQQTTTAQRNTTADRLANFTELSATNETTNDQPTEFTKQLDEIRAQAEKIQSDFNAYKENKGGEMPVQEPTGIEAEVENAKNAALQQISDFESDMAGIQAKLDANYRNLVASTKKVYADRVREMEKANQRLLQTKETVGIRTGRQRYTPVMQDGILQQEEIEGIQRVQKLNNDLNMALAEAADAKAANDLKLFNASYDRIESIRKQAQETIVKLYDQANKELELQQAAAKEQRLADKEALDLAIKASDQVAPAIAARISDLSTPEQQAEFINKMAIQVGVDPTVLLGSVYDAMQEADKMALDMKNIESQIGVRWSSENRQNEKWTQEQQDRSDKDTLRMSIVEKLDSGAISIDQARTAWGMVFPLDEFEKEFTGYIDEI